MSFLHLYNCQVSWMSTRAKYYFRRAENTQSDCPGVMAAEKLVNKVGEAVSRSQSVY